MSETTILQQPVDRSLSKESGSTPQHGLGVQQDFFVTWDNPPDQESNPRNWPSGKKWRNMLLVASQTTLTPLASSILGPAAISIADDFNITNAYVINLPVALYVLGQGLGPLVLAPMSEIYGRKIVYMGSLAAFLVLNIACAVSPDMPVLCFFRFLTGAAGSASVSLGGASVGDLFDREHRGKAQSLYGFGPTGGPVLGGIVGGFITYYTSTWRWCLWVLVIASGTSLAACLLFQKETSSAILLQRKAEKLRKETGQPWEAGKTVKAGEHMLRSINRPLRLLLFSPICTAISVFAAVVYGFFYLHLVTVPLLFTPNPRYGLFSYQWDGGVVGLSYLGIGMGFMLGLVMCAVLLNPLYRWMQQRAASKQEVNMADQPATESSPTAAVSKGEPEFRLPVCQLGALIVPIGLIMYAWTTQKHVQWMAPLVAAAIFAFGIVIMYIPVQAYLVDTFEEYAASALGAMIFLRSVGGCLFSIFGDELYKSLDYGWGTMLLAFIWLAICPMPSVLYYYGPRLRRNMRREGSDAIVLP